MKVRGLLLAGLVGCHTASGSATVTVEGASAAGVEVYFQDADSGLLAHATTDAAGVATGEMAAGGFVTVIDPFGHDAVAGAQVYTFVDAQPDDQLVLRAPHPPFDMSLRATTTITFPASPDPLVTQYQVFAAGCQVGGYPDTIAGSVVTKQLELSGCAPTVDLLVMAFHDAEHLQWGFAGDVAVASAVDLGALTWAVYTPQTVTFDDVPPTITYVAGASSVATAHGAIFGSTVGNGTSTVAMPDVPGAQNWLTLSARSATSSTMFKIVDALPFMPTYRMDVGARLLGDATTCPVYLREPRTLTWTEAAGGVAADFVTGTLDVKPQAGDAWTWRVLGPASGTALVLPELPAELPQLRIAPLDFYAVKTITRGTVAGGYEELLASGMWPAPADIGYQNDLAALGSASIADTPGCRPL